MIYGGDRLGIYFLETESKYIVKSNKLIEVIEKEITIFENN